LSYYWTVDLRKDATPGHVSNKQDTVVPVNAEADIQYDRKGKG